MNAFNTSWTSALSMTLLHSLWQGLLITLLTTLILKIFVIKSSYVKYFIKTGAFFFLFASAFATFFILSEPAKEILSVSPLPAFTVQSSMPTVQPISYLLSITNYLQANQHWIVFGWIVGTFLFSLRFAAGVAYLKYLRVHALPVDEKWNNILKNLSNKLGINRVVQLYESVRIQTPMAIGYLKPVILMPIGLMAGLSTQQVEVILIHELEHIRRHDYLINFIQSLGETIFFFNPFVWILSAWIRNERENCCDDAVLREGYDPKLYATTLYELEVSRLQNTGLALALTGNKNQLLNRIKRIMERSAKNQKGKEKFIPVVLLVLGLVFASWLSINPKEVGARDTSVLKASVNGDTTKNPTTTTYSRKSVITYDANGKPHEEVIETFIGDEGEFDFGFDMPNAPDTPEVADLANLIEIPEIGDIHSMMAPLQNMKFDMVPSPVVPFPSSFNFNIDTLPELTHYNIILDDELMSEFEAILKSDFNIKNQAEMEKVMAEVQAKVAKMNQQMAFDVAHIAPVPSIPAEALHEAELAQIHAMEAIRVSEEQMKLAEELMGRNEAHTKVMEEKMKQFEKEPLIFIPSSVKWKVMPSTMLIKDSHLKKGINLWSKNKGC